MATHSSILAFRIPWTEEPGGLQSTGSETIIPRHMAQMSISVKIAKVYKNIGKPLAELKK